MPGPQDENRSAVDRSARASPGSDGEAAGAAEPDDQVHPQLVDSLVDGVRLGKAWVVVTDAERLWKECAEALRAQVADSIWKTWFEGIAAVSLDDEAVTLAVPNALVRERLEGRYLSLVQDAVSDVLGQSFDYVITVCDRAKESCPVSRLFRVPITLETQLLRP